MRFHNVMEDKKQVVDKGEYLKRGEACGMLHYADLQGRYIQERNFMMYAETFDALIEEGWTVADV